MDKRHPELSVRRQCALLEVARSTVGYRPVPEKEEDRRIKRLLDEIHMIDPCLGSRRLVTVLERDHGIRAGRERIQGLRREMGVGTIWCRPRTTSIPHKAHRKYPYLLREKAVTAPDVAWCADITYVPMPGGDAYLCAVMDWYSRKVLGWALSNTMGAELCVEALERAKAAGGGRLPGIFNTDQGSQFTSAEWVAAVEGMGARVSMDGRGRWLDNVFIERLWRSLKYECVYLHEFATIPALDEGLRVWMKRYNDWRPHESLGNLTPSVLYGPPGRGLAPVPRAA